MNEHVLNVKKYEGLHDLLGILTAFYRGSVFIQVFMIKKIVLCDTK